MARVYCVAWGRVFIPYQQTHFDTRRAASPDTKILPCRRLNNGPMAERHPWNRRNLQVVAATEGSAKSEPSDPKIPSWAKPDSDELPPWARKEGKGQSADPAEQAFQIPFYVYLLSSAIVAIAAVGSMFEYVNQKPVFGLLNPDSVFYAPVLGFFAFSGIPTSVFLWFKSIETANKAAEEQDRKDGYK